MILRRWFLIVSLFPFFAHGAGPLHGGLDLGLSTAGSYEARNVFIQPAALGFDTALNGAELTTSFAFGGNTGSPDDLAFAFAWGYLGFGVEKLAFDGLNRYQFAAGIPIGSRVFFGTRLGLYRFNSGAAMDSWDLGLQYRPSKYFSIGVLMDQLNEPLLSGVRQPILSTASLAFRPLPNLELTVDATTPGNAFLKTVAAQGVLGLQVSEGVRFRVGYHSDYQWLMGLQIHLGVGSLFTTIQPQSRSKRFVVGFQSGTKPYATSVAPPKAVRISIGPTLSDEKSSGSLFAAARPSLLDLLRDLEEIEKDATTHTLLLRIEDFPLGLASAHEVYAALVRVRRSGKRIEAFLGNAGIKQYMVASAADKIYLEPAGEIRWLGVKSERYFLKGTLDKIGVEGEFLAAGKYKAAPEMFTRKSSSEDARTSALEEMKSLQATLEKVLRQSRGIDADRWKKLLDLGLLSADEAKKEGLVDGFASFSTVIAQREKEEWILPVMRRRRDALALPPRVTVVVAAGNILPNRIRLLALGGEDQVTPSTMEKKFKRAKSDPRTEAIVLRVSSPGGEVLASQQIASQIEELKTHLPVFASMGDVAASGGYYISAPANRVFADPMTVTGSIGVFLGKFNLAGLYRFLDLHKEVMTQAPYPGLYSEERPWTKTERAVMERRLHNYYDSFLQYVAEQRSVPRPKVAEAAQGRVWTGTQALEHRLVDELGGYYETLLAAGAARGYAPGEFEVNEIEAGGGLFEMFSDDTWARARSSATLSLLPPEMRDWLWVTELRHSPFLYLAPITPPDA